MVPVRTALILPLLRIFGIHPQSGVGIQRGVKMRIGYSRMLYAAILAAASSLGGSALAGPIPVPVPEYCTPCATYFSGGECYDFRNGCTYPPCTTPKNWPPGRDPNEAKLLCATCRASCPPPSGTKLLTEGPAKTPVQAKARKKAPQKQAASPTK